MSPPEVWGPAVWTLFHTFSEKLNPNAYNQVISSFFGIIVQICKVLPCPECSKDASNFLAKIKLSDYKTKDDFKNMLYLFHNYVNAKKRKPLYNYAYMNKYSSKNIISVINDFIAKYNTKGNMKLLTESFQRSFVIKNFISWFKRYKLAFINPTILNISQQITSNPNASDSNTSDSNTSEPITSEPITSEPITSEPINSEPINSEPITSEPITSEPITYEQIFPEKSKQEILHDVEEKILEDFYILQSNIKDDIITNQNDELSIQTSIDVDQTSDKSIITHQIPVNEDFKNEQYNIEEIDIIKKPKKKRSGKLKK